MDVAEDATETTPRHFTEKDLTVRFLKRFIAFQDNLCV